MSMSTPVESPSVARPRKVLVVFKNAGDAPPLKQKKFKIKGEEKFAAVIAFLRGQLNRETLVSLHAYLFHFLDRRRDSLVLCRNFIVASFQLLILYQCLTV
ncbi:hypothetical protein KC19_1G030200 [Ceratodon purpureus]|uniref:Ubiquitin-like protein ATG12 n=1 Tax=Ceratodon purpureus TaxID=3225 RepID=A0A8T0J206_CERPU|nr:hypothetical protein KC19_1G030200 [Ceratodon purpureus]